MICHLLTIFSYNLLTQVLQTPNCLADAFPKQIGRVGVASRDFGHENVILIAPTKKPLLEQNGAIIFGAEDLVQENTEATTTMFPEQETTIVEFVEENFDQLFEDEDTERRKWCPNTSFEYLYDPDAKKCSRDGTKGHCGNGMKFQANESNAISGYCECDFELSKVPMIYHEQSFSCFHIYEQAYCGYNQWLVFNSELQPACKQRTCKNGRSYVNVPLNGTGPCVRLNGKSKYCEPDEVVQFPPESVIPTCFSVSIDKMPRILAPASSLKCPPGSHLSITRKCITSWTWG